MIACTWSELAMKLQVEVCSQIRLRAERISHEYNQGIFTDRIADRGRDHSDHRGDSDPKSFAGTAVCE
jgi:hypothetical protein